MKTKRKCSKTIVFCLYFFLSGFVYFPVCWAEGGGNDATPDSAVPLLEVPANWESDGRNASPPGSSSPQLCVSAASFSVSGSGTSAAFYDYTIGAWKGIGSGDFGCIQTGIDLPQGSTIWFFAITYYDNDPTYDLIVALKKLRGVDGVFTLLGLATSESPHSDTVRVVSSDSIDDVVQSSNSYELSTCLRSNLMRLYQVRVYYSLQNRTYFKEVYLVN